MNDDIVSISKVKWTRILCSVYQTGWKDAVSKIKETDFNCLNDDLEERNFKEEMNDSDYIFAHFKK